ncbi:MAG: ATP-binding protein [Rhodospirillales bacterium]
MATTSKNILDSLPDPVIVVDNKRMVIQANLAALELMPGDTIGRDLAHSLRHPLALELVDNVIKGGTVELEDPESLVEIEYTTPLRRSFSLHIVQALSDRDNEETQIVIFLRETTADKRAEQMRVDFVTNISHELRSPLSALVGFIETLQDAAKDDREAQQRFLEIMSREAGRMSRLVEDLLSLSSVEMNEHVRPRDSVEITKIVNSVIESLSVRAAEKNLELKLETEELLPPVVGDSDQLTQVVQNLIDNAIKYGGHDSTIEIKVDTTERVPQTGGPGLKISVRDFGDGIPEEQITRLTERFYRIDKARSRNLGGTGLGLAIVKHIMNRHRGNLEIQSTEGEGSTFSIFLPVKTGQNPSGGA